MDKKKIVIVIVVFLLLGTMVFSFANPRTEDEQLEGNDPSTEEQGGNQDDDQDDDETQGNEDDDQTDDDQQGDDTPVVGDDDTDEQTTDYLFLAQQAVEKAEQSLAQGDVTAANDAIQDVIENANEDVSDLQDRIETVQNIIDFEKLLTQLENKTNGTTNKDELDVVRNDKETKTTTTTLDNLVENLANVETNADKITNLTNRYNTVLAKLNDTTPPSVSGINNGEYTKGPVNLTITDNSSFTATLSKDGGEATNYVTGTEIPEDGEYTLTVIDSSFNENVIKFTINNIAPEFNINSGKHFENTATVTVNDQEFSYILVINKNNNIQTRYEESSVTLTDEATYEIIAYDKAGNSSTIWIAIDNTNPTMKGTANNGEDVTLDSTLTPITGNYQSVNLNFEDKFLMKVVIINGESTIEYTRADFEVGANNESFKFTYDFVTEGTYTVKAYDKFGHETVATFTIDQTKPTAEVTMSNNNGLTSTKDNVTVTLVASEDILDIEGWTKVDSKTFTKVFTENVKNYQVVITDLVGNKNTITFEVKRIDKVPPVLTVVDPNRYDIEVNTPYVDKGYSAYDVVDKDLTNRVTMTYQFLPLGSGNWEVVDGVDTSKLGTYKITYHVTDKAGNEATATRSFEIVDSSLPVITVKEESIGSIDENIYSNVSFKLYDAHLVAKAELNGVEKELTPSSWSDFNYITVGKYGAVYGENTLVLYDVYGNKTEYKFTLDNKVPQLAPEKWTVEIEASKDATFTCPDMTAFGSDEYGIKSVVLDQYYNDHLTNVDVTKPGKFVCRYITTDKAGNKASNDITYKVVDTTDPVFPNLIDGTITNDKVSLVVTDLDFDYILITNNDTKYSWKETRDWTSFHLEGNYTVVAYDKSGNASESYTFTIDKTLPKLGAANILVSGDVNEQEVFYATNGDKINVYVRFNEELKHNPTFTLINNGKEYVIADEDVVVRSFDDGQYQYSILFEITKDVDMIDGEITMLVSNIEDLAGNKYQDINEPTNGHIVYLDRTLDFNINNIVNGYMNSVPYIGMEDASPFTVVVTSNDKVIDNRPSTEGTDAYYAAFQLFNLADGKYEVTATDAAGNSKTIVFIYDTTLAARVYSTVDFDGTGITPKVEGTRKTYYVNNGTSFVFRMQFTEQLSENPILNVGNKTVELELVEKFVTNEGKYIYQGTVEINEEDNFADGSLPLILSNVKDLAGNVTLDEAVLNQTITSNDRTVVIDNTPSTAKPLYILARDDASYRLSISDGEYLRVEANFNEELSKKPTLTVGSQSIEFDRCNFNSDETRYVCVADIKIDNSIARLVEGENIPFTVTNIYDLAGNPSEFNNDDVTDYYRDDELVYSNVKFENPFVSMSFHNSTNYKLNEENNNTDLSVTEAKVGDTVRVFVRFNQDIDIENFKPIIVIGGVAKELNLSNIYNDGTKDYGADITITKEMNLKLNEEIPFVIKNIVLKNGNNLPNLNQDDITSTNLSGVIYIGE